MHSLFKSHTALFNSHHWHHTVVPDSSSWIWIIQPWEVRKLRKSLVLLVWFFYIG